MEVTDREIGNREAVDGFLRLAFYKAAEELNGFNLSLDRNCGRRKSPEEIWANLYDAVTASDSELAMLALVQEKDDRIAALEAEIDRLRSMAPMAAKLEVKP